MREQKARSALLETCVPILEAGIPGFVNATYDLSYAEAFERLDAEYLPAFQQTWDSLSRRLWPYRFVLARRVSYRAAFRFATEIRRLL